MERVECWQDHRGPILDRVESCRVIDCTPCGFKHIVPIPTRRALNALYSQKYYTRQYAKRIQADLSWWDLVFADRYDTLEEHLPSHRRQLLDVGSGLGYFLLHGQRRGWQVTGIEPSAEAAAYARQMGLTVKEFFLEEDTADRLGTFDAIHLSEVLEHLPDPGATLELLHRRLAPEGVICIVVPNDYNPFQWAARVVGETSPWWVKIPHHINYFDLSSLRRLLTRRRFEILHEEATFPIDLFRLMGNDHAGNDDLARDSHHKRTTFEANLAAVGLTALKRKLYRALAELDIGGELFVVARRQ